MMNHRGWPRAAGNRTDRVWKPRSRRGGTAREHSSSVSDPLGPGARGVTVTDRGKLKLADFSESSR
eukprot:748409-Hanusia_phi.AAC.1